MRPYDADAFEQARVALGKTNKGYLRKQDAKCDRKHVFAFESENFKGERCRVGRKRALV